MNLLKKGITGLHTSYNFSSHSKGMVKAFLSKIKYPNLMIGELQEPKMDSNYYRCTIENRLNKEQFDLLLHEGAWIVAAVESSSTWGNLAFIDVPASVKGQIRKEELRILDREILIKPVPAEELEVLDPIELEAIRYWRVRTYGEIVFNGFD